MGPVEVTFIPDPDNLPRRGPTVCFTELLNHRQAEVGRDPWVPLVPPCPSRHTLSRGPAPRPGSFGTGVASPVLSREGSPLFTCWKYFG